MFTLNRLLWASAILAALVVMSGAYKTGAPNAACASLTPKHKNWTGQATPSPFKISAKRSGDTVDVTISGSDKFKGFLLVARTGASDDNVGEWLPVDNAKLVKCSSENDAVTHKLNTEKSSISLKWKAPAGFKDSICFKGAIVKNGRTFWTDVSSNTVKF